jgi:HEAT repeat protein
MSALAALAFVVVAGCKETCLKYVTDPRLKANLCGRCFTQSDRAAWAEGFIRESPASAPALLDDEDWAVRWAALKKDNVQLGSWVERDTGVKACTTALHAAGANKLRLASVLTGRTLAKCVQQRDAAKAQIEVDLYSADPTIRLEALQHLANVFEKPPARVVLDAMQTRAPQTDELSAAVLREGASPAGAALLAAPKQEADTPLINRLLAVYAKQIDALKPKLKDPEATSRREAIRALAELAPMSAPELESALDDKDAVNRRAAASALAKGEGKTVVALARARLTPQWIALAGGSGDAECRGFLEDVAFNANLKDDVRTAAMPALVDCEGASALAPLERALDEKEPWLRAAAAAALGGMPRVTAAEKKVDALLNDRDPLVLAAAVRSAGALRLKTAVARLVALLEEGDAGVRREVPGALATLEATATVPKLAKALQTDADPAVREACARALGALGGNSGVSALIAASQADKDDKVKLAAGESLRRLGFKKSP